MKTSMRLINTLLTLLAALLFGLAPALAIADTASGTQSGVSATTTGAHLTALETRAKTRADAEIDRRITNLNQLSSRISSIKNLSDANKTTIQATVSAQISALQGLKAKIDVDTDSAVLKTDIASITASYRVYALLIPQVEIIAAADRIVTIAGGMQQLSAKFQTRISSAQSAGKDVSLAANAFTDMGTKLTDAQAQAQAAVSGIATLVPDQGDKTKLAANTMALKDARAKVVTGQKDLRAAQHDSEIIIKNLKGKGDNSSVTSTTSPSGI